MNFRNITHLEYREEGRVPSVVINYVEGNYPLSGWEKQYADYLHSVRYVGVFLKSAFN